MTQSTERRLTIRFLDWPVTIQLSGDAGQDMLLGGSGDDRLSGGADDDFADGGDGGDQILGDDGDDVVVGGAGWDSSMAASATNFIDGGPPTTNCGGFRATTTVLRRRWPGPALRQ